MFDDLYEGKVSRNLNFALYGFGSSFLAYIFGYPALQVVCASLAVSFLVLVVIDPSSVSFRNICPFVLKRTAMRIIRDEQARMLFMKCDELFQGLPAFELSRHSTVSFSGAALLDENAKPVCLKKFNYPRTVIEGDQVYIRI